MVAQLALRFKSQEEEEEKEEIQCEARQIERKEGL